MFLMEQFIQKKGKKAQYQASIVILCSFMIVICHLPFKCFFYSSFHAKCQTSLIERAQSIWWFFSTSPSPFSSRPLRWKWCMWQNSAINIIKEFHLQKKKSEHLLGWARAMVSISLNAIDGSDGATTVIHVVESQERPIIGTTRDSSRHQPGKICTDA